MVRSTSEQDIQSPCADLVRPTGRHTRTPGTRLRVTPELI